MNNMETNLGANGTKTLNELKIDHLESLNEEALVGGGADRGSVLPLGRAFGLTDGRWELGVRNECPEETDWADSRG